MRVQRADVDDVKQKLLELKRKKTGGNAIVIPTAQLSAIDEQDKRIEQEELKKKQRKEQSKRKLDELIKDETADQEDDELKNMLGFGGFKTKKK
jgi:hypothetical protein